MEVSDLEKIKLDEKKRNTTERNLVEESNVLKKSKLFMDKWLEMPMFRKWLRPFKDDKTKAWCVTCNIVLVAGLSELLKHAQTIKHEKATHSIERSVIVENRPKNRQEPPAAAALTPVIKTSSTSSSCTDYNIEDITIVGGEHDDVNNVIRRRKSQRPSSASVATAAAAGSRKRQKMSENSIQTDDNGPGRNLEKLEAGEGEDKCRAFVCSPVPFWKATAMINGHTRELKLTDYRGHYLLMIFYPCNFDTLSANEIHAVNDNIATFRELDTEVVGCSMDSCDAHRAWYKTNKEDHGIPYVQFPLLSDPSHSIAELYGCYNHHMGYPLRASYIIDKKGVLRYMTISDLPVARSINDMIGMLHEIQKIDTQEEQKL